MSQKPSSMTRVMPSQPPSTATQTTFDRPLLSSPAGSGPKREGSHVIPLGWTPMGGIPVPITSRVGLQWRQSGGHSRISVSQMCETSWERIFSFTFSLQLLKNLMTSWETINDRKGLRRSPQVANLNTTAKAANAGSQLLEKNTKSCSKCPKRQMYQVSNQTFHETFISQMRQKRKQCFIHLTQISFHQMAFQLVTILCFA